MSLQSKADWLLQQAVDEGGVPGVVAMATDRSDTIYAGGWGERIAGTGIAMTPDTVGWIASMTKALTAACAMQLVEQGKLDLDGPAAKVVPDLAKAVVLEGFAADGTPRTRAPRQAITLRHLLTHTAGFGYDIWSPEITRYMERTGTPGVISCDDAALTTPLLFDPGERWLYGISIDWAGKMVEAVSGQRLGAYMKANLLDPLGMTDAAFRITPSMRDRLARIHVRGAAGFEPLDLELPQDPGFDMGGGGLYATVGDYLKFIRMMLNDGSGNGNRVLQAETVAAMSRNQMGDARVVLLKTANPALSNDAEFFPGMAKTWGLSFMLNEAAAPSGRSPGSLAWAGLANSYFWIDQTRGLGGAYMTQLLPFADKTALPLFDAFEKTVYGNVS
jgi:methyl acetate hydrolase